MDDGQITTDELKTLGRGFLGRGGLFPGARDGHGFRGPRRRSAAAAAGTAVRPPAPRRRRPADRSLHLADLDARRHVPAGVVLPGGGHALRTGSRRRVAAARRDDPERGREMTPISARSLPPGTTRTGRASPTAASNPGNARHAASLRNIRLLWHHHALLMGIRGRPRRSEDGRRGPRADRPRLTRGSRSRGPGPRTTGVRRSRPVRCVSGCGPPHGLTPGPARSGNIRLLMAYTTVAWLMCMRGRPRRSEDGRRGSPR